MIEQNGGKSHLTYEYDSDNCLVKRTLTNPTTGIRSVNEYRYNTSFEIIQQSLKRILIILQVTSMVSNHR